MPQPGPGEVRVKIRFSPMNPSDLLYVRGHYSGVAEHFPSGAGFEGVATIDAWDPGSGARRRAAGLRPDSNGGNWAQYAVVPAAKVYPVPDDIADEQIASFRSTPRRRSSWCATCWPFLAGMAAAVRRRRELGRIIIRLAKHDGIRTINVVRRREAVQNSRSSARTR